MFSLVTLGLLVVLIVRLIPWWKRQSEAEAQAPPRTEDEKARDRRTATIWGCAAVAVPVVLLLAYVLTR